MESAAAITRQPAGDEHPSPRWNAAAASAPMTSWTWPAPPCSSSFRRRTMAMPRAYDLLFTDTPGTATGRNQPDHPRWSALTARHWQRRTSTTPHRPPAATALPVKLNVPVMPGDSVTVDYRHRLPHRRAAQRHLEQQRTDQRILVPARHGRSALRADGPGHLHHAEPHDGSAGARSRRWWPPTDKAVIGEEVEYRITVPRGNPGRGAG